MVHNFKIHLSNKKVDFKSTSLPPTGCQTNFIHTTDYIKQAIFIPNWNLFSWLVLKIKKLFNLFLGVKFYIFFIDGN